MRKDEFSIIEEYTKEKIMFNGTPLLEELEKIKEEMEKKGWYNRHDKEQFAEIIDKHIKEIEQERTRAAGATDPKTKKEK